MSKVYIIRDARTERVLKTSSAQSHAQASAAAYKREQGLACIVDEYDLDRGEVIKATLSKRVYDTEQDNSLR